MQRILTSLVAISLLLSPSATFAQEAATADESADIAPLYLYTLENDQLLGIVPISPTVAAVCVAQIATSTEIEDPSEILPDPECGLLVLSYNTSTSQVESGEGVVSSGNVVQVLDYYPYGTKRIESGEDVSDREFIGQYYDEDTELSYLNARYYDGARGQFTSQDPTFLHIGDPTGLQNLTGLTQDAILADPQQMNSYAYGRNNPIRFKDPKGLYIESGFDVAMLGVSLYQFYQEPSWTNAGAVFLDAGALALPVPAVGGMALRAGKAADATYSAYKGYDAANELRYVGITSRTVAERAAEHARDIGSGREFLRFEKMPGTGNLTQSQARTLYEQPIINQYGLQKNGGQLLNKINSVSPSSQLYKSVPSSPGGGGGSSLSSTLSSLSSALQKLSSALSSLFKK